MSKLDPPPPVPLGPLGLLRFAGIESRIRRPLAQVAEILNNPGELSLDEQGVILFRGYTWPTRDGRTLTPPCREIAIDEWLRWFARVGFMLNGFRVPSMSPSGPVTVFRAATPGYRDGLSWGDTLATIERVGEWRSDQLRELGKTRAAAAMRIYTATVNPGKVLAVHRIATSPHGMEFIADVPVADIEEMNP